MDITTIVVAFLGGLGGILAGILAYIKFFAERKDKREREDLDLVLEEHLAPLRTDIAGIKSENVVFGRTLREVQLDTTRTQLLMFMQHQPRNYDTILKIAHRYFVDLQGNWYMAVEFQKWATEQGIEVPLAISQAIAQNER